MVEKIKETAESSVTVKAAAIIGILCLVIGAGFSKLDSHETRISKMEACVIGIQSNAELTQKIVLAIREDQVAFYRGHNPAWKSSFDLRQDAFKKVQ